MTSEQHFRIRKGLDIPIAGAVDGNAVPGAPVVRVGLVGIDHVGLAAKLVIEQGDHVTLGQTLFVDRHCPDIRWTAPGTGVVETINHGERRRLLSIVIRLEDEAVTAPAGDAAAAPRRLGRDDVVRLLTGSGLWIALRARPFGRVPRPDSVPAALFITAMDSEPLASDPAAVIAGEAEAFSYGMAALTKLTDGPVFVCARPGDALRLPEDPEEQIQVVRFSGPHPAGLPGTHAHFLMPAARDRTVWHIGYQDVIAIGKLVTEGRHWMRRTVALAGPATRTPALVQTRLGANLADLTVDALFDAPSRLVSGSALSGRTAAPPCDFLGRYHSQVTALPAAPSRHEWYEAFSAFGLARLFRRPRYSAVMAHGDKGPMIPFEPFDRVMPLDLMTAPLLRSLLAGDIEMAEALGCLELEEEDLALCSYVCPGRNDYGAALRGVLSRLEQEQ